MGPRDSLARAMREAERAFDTCDDPAERDAIERDLREMERDMDELDRQEEDHGW